MFSYKEPSAVEKLSPLSTILSNYFGSISLVIFCVYPTVGFSSGARNDFSIYLRLRLPTCGFFVALIPHSSSEEDDSSIWRSAELKLTLSWSSSSISLYEYYISELGELDLLSVAFLFRRNFRFWSKKDSFSNINLFSLSSWSNCFWIRSISESRFRTSVSKS